MLHVGTKWRACLGHLLSRFSCSFYNSYAFQVAQVDTRRPLSCHCSPLLGEAMPASDVKSEGGEGRESEGGRERESERVSERERVRE